MKLHISSIGYYFQITMIQVVVGYVGFKSDAVVLANLTSVRKLFAEGKLQSLVELNGSTSNTSRLTEIAHPSVSARFTRPGESSSLLFFIIVLQQRHLVAREEVRRY